MRVIFMGSSSFGIPTLKALHKDHHVLGVWTSPPKPQNRGQKIAYSSVHTVANTLSIPVFAPSSLKDPSEQDIIKNLKPDVIVVVAYGLILPRAVIEIPAHGCLNIHGSILPKWRGAAPIQRAIEHGDTEIGLTIMKIDMLLDHGPILTKRSRPLTINDRTSSVMEEFSHIGKDAMLEVLTYINDIPEEPQVHTDATYAEKIAKEEGLLDPINCTALALQRKVHAFDVWPGTWYKDLRIIECETIEGELYPPGSWIQKYHIPLGIQCKKDILSITKIQIPSKKPMTIQEFLNGYRHTFHFS